MGDAAGGNSQSGRSGAVRGGGAGFLLGSAGVLGLPALQPGTSVVATALLLVPLGVGGGLAVPTLTTVLLENVSAASAGLASGVFNAARQMGSALAVALFGSLVAGRASFHTGMTASIVISLGLLLAAAGGVARLRRRAGSP